MLLIVFACGALSLIVRSLEPATAAPGRELEIVLPTATYTLPPTATSPIVPTPSPEPTYTLIPTDTPVPTRTQTPAPTPTATPTVAPTSTPLPTETLIPTDTPQPTATPTRAATETPHPTSTPTTVLPLSMDWVLVEKHCISGAQWFLEFWLTAKGGTGEYTFYRDIERLHGPAPAHGFGYQMYAGTGSAVVGTFAVESGNQRVESEFWIERLDCGHLATPPTPSDPPTPGPVVSPPADGPCSCVADTLNCEDFSTQAQAQACHDHCVATVGRDVHDLDGDDKDGQACEHLP